MKDTDIYLVHQMCILVFSFMSGDEFQTVVNKDLNTKHLQ